MNNTLLLFIDGVGIGEPDPEKNPFFSGRFQFFEKFFGAVPHLGNPALSGKDIELFPVDAKMGIDGIPQSGTGQAAIFCGVNAPQIINQHFGPFPYSTLVPIIKEKNIFKAYLDEGKTVFFVNSYPQVYFDYLNSGRSRMSVTTLSYTSAGKELNNWQDVQAGRSLSAEITNRVWREKLNYTSIPQITPEEAAQRVLDRSSEHDITVFEFFLTDHLGHGRIKHDFDTVCSDLDRFLIYIYEMYKPFVSNVLLCSDHGNFEDISIKSHTMNPAMTIAAGKNAKQMKEGIHSLQDIKSVLMNLT